MEYFDDDSGRNCGSLVALKYVTCILGNETVEQARVYTRLDDDGDDVEA